MDMVGHAFNPSTCKVEAGPGQLVYTVSQKLYQISKRTFLLSFDNANK